MGVVVIEPLIVHTIRVTSSEATFAITFENETYLMSLETPACKNLRPTYLELFEPAYCQGCETTHSFKYSTKWLQSATFLDRRPTECAGLDLALLAGLKCLNIQNYYFAFSSVLASLPLRCLCPIYCSHFLKESALTPFLLSYSSESYLSLIGSQAEKLISVGLASYFLNFCCKDFLGLSVLNLTVAATASSSSSCSHQSSFWLPLVAVWPDCATIVGKRSTELVEWFAVGNWCSFVAGTTLSLLFEPVWKSDLI